LALLQVGLPVQVARVDVTQPAGVARPQQQDIGWHHFVVREMDQIADSHLFPQDLLVARRFAAKKSQQLRSHSEKTFVYSGYCSRDSERFLQILSLLRFSKYFPS
jgi:hypothetical protein